MAETATVSEISSSSCSVNLRTKLLCKSELKSSIPKPAPLASRELIRAKSSSSSHSQPAHSSRIPVPLSRSLDRGSTSLSLQFQELDKNKFNRSRVKQDQIKPQLLSTAIKKTYVRPKSASEHGNPNQTSKAKDNNDKKPSKPQLKSQFKLFSLNERDSNKITDKSTTESPVFEKTIMEENEISNEQLFEKQKQILNSYSELRRLQPPKDLQPLEREICRLMQNKTMEHIENISKENLPLVNGSSPEFLTSFEKQMQEVLNSWMHLICDVITNRLITGISGQARVSMPDLTLNIRDELEKLFSYFPSEGETLLARLQKVEEEMMKANAGVICKGMALSQQYEDLKDRYIRLEKTQDQIHFELKEQIAILGEENVDLDRKYEKAVEMYNKERIKVEQQEKYKITINKDLVEVKKIMKVMEGRCLELETKTKKADAACRALEMTVRNKDIMSGKENKNHREVLNKFNESKSTIDTLKLELSESNQARSALGLENKDLKEELSTLKSTFEELEQKNVKLTEELAMKTIRLSELENDMNLLKGYIGNNPNLNYVSPYTNTTLKHDLTPNVLIEDLTKDVQQRSYQIQELKKRIISMEHVLKEKETREEMLLKQVSEIQKPKPHENEVALKAQIRDLHYELKDMTEEKAELEKIVAQKTLELDQRDLLMREHSHVLRAKDELVPMFQNKQRREKEYIEKLSAIVVEQQKTYSNEGEDQFPNNEEPNFQEMMKALEKRYFVDPKMVDKELTFRQEKMSELFNLLEHKQMEIMKLERRLQHFQSSREEKEGKEKDKEYRMSSLQKALEDRKTGKCRGLFSMFSGQDSSY